MVVADLRGLDFRVVVPAVPGLQLVMLALDDHDRYVTDVAVSADGGNADAYKGAVVRTCGSRGEKPGDKVRHAATMAVADLLLASVPPGLDRSEAHSLVGIQLAAADAIAVDVGAWSTRPMNLDDEISQVMVHRMPEGYAAAVDLVDVTVAMHGRLLPTSWAFRSLTPEQAQRELGGLADD